MSVVIKQLDVNWARLLVNLLIEEVGLITRVHDGDRVVKVKASQPLHHDMKIIFLLLSHLPYHDWSDKVEISEILRTRWCLILNCSSVCFST